VELFTSAPYIFTAFSHVLIFFSAESKLSAEGLWTCEFCDHESKIGELEEEEIPKEEVLDFLLSSGSDAYEYHITSLINCFAFTLVFSSAYLYVIDNIVVSFLGL
jgi:hypothetical protein